MDVSDENLLFNLLDPVIFVESFLKLESPDGMIAWDMDKYQRHLVRDPSRNRAINKSKKTGISTTIAGESIHKAFTMPGRQIIFISTGQRIAEELLGKWYDLFATIPEAMQPQFVKHSVQTASLPNGVRIMSLPSSDPGNIRGFGMRGAESDVYLDEYAHVANDKDLWIVVRDFQIIGGRITLNSTPYGKRGKFYEIVEPLQAVYEGTSEPFKTTWSFHQINFRDCPRLANQEKFLREGMTDIDFSQEYEASFVDESLAFFPYVLINQNQTVTDFAESGYKTKNGIYFGIDFGKTTSETIIYVVEKIAPETFKTLYIEEMAGVNYEDQADIIKMLKIEYDPIAINVDASGPGGITMEDILSSEKYCGPIIHGYDLTSTFKENIIIRLRMLMQRKKLAIPSKEGPLQNIAEKFERQLHSIQRTSTKMGLHTRYSGKEHGGMDDMVWACYDKNTEVLTDTGFKLIKDITIEDKVVTLKQSTSEIEYQSPTNFISYKYTGEMIHFKGKGLDLMVTPNHQIYASKNRYRYLYEGFKLHKAEDVCDAHIKFKKNGLWLGERQEVHTIPFITTIGKKGHNYIRNEVKIPMDLWLEFFGYFISEGHCSNRSIQLWQSLYYNPDKCEQIETCLQKLSKYGFSLKKKVYDKGRHEGTPLMEYRIYSKQLTIYLKQFGTAKYKFIPKELKSLSADQLKILFYALYLGDGATDGYTYYTISPQLADDVMEIILKIGLSSNCTIGRSEGRQDMYKIMLSNHCSEPSINYSENSPAHSKKVPYDDYVYCLEVPNHIIFTRRNGKTVWCGNCALAVYEQFTYEFEPFIQQVQDSVLTKLQNQRANLVSENW